MAADLLEAFIGLDLLVDLGVVCKEGVLALLLFGGHLAAIGSGAELVDL